MSNNDELTTIANDIKNNYNKIIDSDCNTIKLNLIKSLKEFGNTYKPSNPYYASNDFNILGNKDFYYNNFNKVCDVDLNKYQKQLEKITNLKIDIEINKCYEKKNTYNNNLYIYIRTL